MRAVPQECNYSCGIVVYKGGGFMADTRDYAS